MKFSRTFALLAAVSLVAACSTGMASFPADSAARAALDVPQAFVPPPAASAGSARTCWNPMTDPRDGTAITLVRSVGDRGDYEVPEGRYGVARRELLRLDCSTGVVVGIVPR